MHVSAEIILTHDFYKIFNNKRVLNIKSTVTNMYKEVL